MKLNRFGYLAAGLVLGITMSGPVAHAAETVLNVWPSTQKFYLDGQAIQLEAYGINVSRMAQTAGMKYINGTNTVTYFGAVLFCLDKGE